MDNQFVSHNATHWHFQESYNTPLEQTKGILLKLKPVGWRFRVSCVFQRSAETTLDHCWKHTCLNDCSMYKEIWQILTYLHLTCKDLSICHYCQDLLDGCYTSLEKLEVIRVFGKPTEDEFFIKWYKVWYLSSRVNVSVFQSLLSMTWFWLFLFSVIGVLFFTILERIGFLKQANRYDICICGRTTRGFLPSQHLASLHHSYTLLWKHKAVSLRLAWTWPH